MIFENYQWTIILVTKTKKWTSFRDCIVMEENTSWQSVIMWFKFFSLQRHLFYHSQDPRSSSLSFSSTKPQFFSWGWMSLISSNTTNVLMLVIQHGIMQSTMWDWQEKWILNRKIHYFIALLFHSSSSYPGLLLLTSYNPSSRSLHL